MQKGKGRRQTAHANVRDNQAFTASSAAAMQMATATWFTFLSVETAAATIGIDPT